MVHELKRGGPRGGLFPQTMPHKVEQLGREPRLREDWRERRVLGRQRPIDDRLHEVKVARAGDGPRVGVGADGALERDQPDAPHVRRVAVPVANNPLRAHVLRCAAKRARDGHRVLELPADAKVGELDVAAAREQDVGRLQVAMQLVLLLVQEDEALQHLHHDLAERQVADAARLARDVLERAGVHEFEGEVYDPLEVKGVVQPHQVVAPHVVQHFELVDHLLPERRILHRRQLLEREHLAAGRMVDELDNRRSA
mmetsp:Transcript_18889/g.58891  ORF Transcript_18889/g.58891 Transcript_18889/m.58891 type:complete len:255 (-) Transcript_18889:75-839(-)